MANLLFKLVLLLLLLAWSGHFVFRLSIGILGAWRSGRCESAAYERGQTVARVVRAAGHPVAFWFTMVVWHVMLAAFLGVFGFGAYSFWRVLLQG
jgi:hypothetical protein